jgi:hypothetical protein
MISWSEWQDLNLRPLRPERCYRSGNINKTNDFRTALTTIIAVCSRGFGGQSVVRALERSRSGPVGAVLSGNWPDPPSNKWDP